MRADFSRDTFDPARHFSRVLFQQGRVQLDADYNEQTAIVLHYLRTLTADLLGPHAGPSANAGFAIMRVGELSAEERAALRATNESVADNDLAISAGRYYVAGQLVENDALVAYKSQADLRNTETLGEGGHLLYLDVWEQLVTAAEDSTIGEVALGGPDTAARARVVWQVKAAPLQAGDSAYDFSSTKQQVLDQQPRARARLLAQTADAETNDDPCVIPPESRYRGLENQLYRVEIHTGDRTDNARFKWSRENGSVVFPILSITSDIQDKTTTVRLAHLGRDTRLSLAEGDWVEIVDNADVLSGAISPIGIVDAIDRVGMVVTLRDIVNVGAQANPRLERPVLRRWDQRSGTGFKDGTLGTSTSEYIDLEDGIQVKFELGPLRPGDYWLIPARTATGDIEWPRQRQGNELRARGLPPRHIVHSYAWLALVEPGDGSPIITDLRCLFSPLGCLTDYEYGFGGEAIGGDNM